MSRRPLHELHRIFAPDGPLARGLGPDRYEDRPGQLAMAVKVADALEEEARLVVEAGTGTGKTMAYLVPALLSGQKVVVSTGTKTLQDQLIKRDIPLLLALLGLDVKVAVMKGLGNYLCRRRLDEVRRAGSDLLLMADPLLDRVFAWAEVTQSGDRAELEELGDRDRLWSEVSPTPESRIGPKCPFYEECFITAMRRRAVEAQLVVVNHHLLFADLSMRQTSPDRTVIPAHDALILDEAHQLEDVATDFFGQVLSSAHVPALCRDGRREPGLREDAKAQVLLEQLEGAAAELFHVLDRGLPTGSTGPAFSAARTADGSPPGLRLRLHEPPLAGTLEPSRRTVEAHLEALEQHLLASRVEGAVRDELEHLARRAADLRQALDAFARPAPATDIQWVERRRQTLVLHASPVEVGPLLAATLLREPMPIVFTSATLAVGSGRQDRRPSVEGRMSGAGHGLPALSFFRQSIGLERLPEPPPWEPDPGLAPSIPNASEPGRPTSPEAPASDPDPPCLELLVPSPFDFGRQALLYLPQDLPLPASEEFIVRATRRIEELLILSRGRALLLFTSHRNLRAAQALLDGKVPYRLLCQGDRPRTLLLEEFRRDIESVLLATQSFWEGVDVVGEALSLVVIDKLPFAVPDDPITEARIERLRRLGQSPFDQYQLPRAALALKQGFGRLIRHRTDRGVVAILDRRLGERGYGRTLRASLPPCPSTARVEEVRAFFDARVPLENQR